MKKLLSFLLLTLALSAVCVAQETQTRRSVTINVTKGEPVRGLFVRADDNAVTIQSGVAETTVKLEDVVSIVFEGAAPSPSPEPVKADESSRKAIDALRKLASATEVGVNFTEYGRILIEVKSEIDGLLPKMEAGTTKDLVTDALAHYVYANEIWNHFVRYPRERGIATKSDLGRFLINTYNIPMKVSVWTSITRDTAVSYIWARARQNYEAAKDRIEK